MRVVAARRTVSVQRLQFRTTGMQSVLLGRVVVARSAVVVKAAAPASSASPCARRRVGRVVLRCWWPAGSPCLRRRCRPRGRCRPARDSSDCRPQRIDLAQFCRARPPRPAAERFSTNFEKVSSCFDQHVLYLRMGRALVPNVVVARRENQVDAGLTSRADVAAGFRGHRVHRWSASSPPASVRRSAIIQRVHQRRRDCWPERRTASGRWCSRDRRSAPGC